MKATEFTSGDGPDDVAANRMRTSRTGMPGFKSGGSLPGRFLTVVAAACLTAATAHIAAAATENSTDDKRVENRGTPTQSSPSSTGPKPARSEGTPPSKPSEKCDKDRRADADQTTQVQETTTVIQQETVVVEVPVPVEASFQEFAFPEVVQDTIGRRRMEAVLACTDPRYPLPGYAFVGIQPVFAPRSGGDTVRLERLDCEIEVGPGWQPDDSIFTLTAGSAMFQVPLPRDDRAEVALVADIHTGRKYPLSASLAKSGSSTQARRRVVTFHFLHAASGRAPRLQPEDAVLISIDPSPTAPPDYEMPRFLLVQGTPDSPSTLRLVEKSGTRTSVLPSVSTLELAAHCSVLHRIPQ